MVQTDVHFSPEDLSERDNYKFLIGSVLPRPIALVSTISTREVVNLAPFSYFNIVSANPPILSLAIQRQGGELKDTARNLLANGSAVIHVVDQDNLTDVNQTAGNVPSDVSELAYTHFTTVPSLTTIAPGINESNIRFETELLERVAIEHKGVATADLFLLKVKQYHINGSLYHDGKIDSEKLGPISRLAGNDYAEIGERHTLVRPILKGGELR